MPCQFQSQEEYKSKLVELLEAEDQAESLKEEAYGEANIPFEFKQVFQETSVLEMHVSNDNLDMLKVNCLVEILLRQKE